MVNILIRNVLKFTSKSSLTNHGSYFYNINYNNDINNVVIILRRCLYDIMSFFDGNPDKT